MIQSISFYYYTLHKFNTRIINAFILLFEMLRQSILPLPSPIRSGGVRRVLRTELTAPKVLRYAYKGDTLCKSFRVSILGPLSKCRTKVAFGLGLYPSESSHA